MLLCVYMKPALTKGQAQDKTFQVKWKSLPQEQKDEILEEARIDTAMVAAKKYSAELEMPISILYQLIDNELKGRKSVKVVEVVPTVPRKEVPETGLTDADVELLARFKEGKVGYDEIQKELAYKVFKKILENPDSVKIRDWLQSELIKLKKDETTRQKEALEKFINSLFGGFIPSTRCPHCGKGTVIKTETLGEVFHGAELQED